MGRKRRLSWEKLELRSLLAVDTIAIVVTHGQQGCTLDNPTDSWPGAIASTFDAEIDRFIAEEKNAAILGDELKVAILYPQWDSCGAISRQALVNAAFALERIADSAGQPIDVLFVGHSRGTIFTNRLVTEMADLRPDLPNKLDFVYGVYLDPTAARPFGDNYPTTKPPLMDALTVYDDELAFDRDVPVLIAKSYASDAGCTVGAAIGTAGGPIGAVIGCAVGYVAAGAAAEYAAETLERWGLDIKVGATVDGKIVHGGSYKRVGGDVQDFLEANPNGRVRASQNFAKAGLKSIARHTAIHWWYAQDAASKSDVSTFLKARNPVTTAIALKNTTQDPIDYEFQWSNNSKKKYILEPGETRRHWIDAYDAVAKLTTLSKINKTYSLRGFMTSNENPELGESKIYWIKENNGIHDVVMAPLLPDLSVETLDISVIGLDPTGLTVLSYSGTIKNVGQSLASASKLRLFATEGLQIPDEKNQILSLSLPRLNPQSTKSFSGQITLPLDITSGTKTFRYKLTGTADELRYRNNQGVATELYVRNVAKTRDEPNDAISTATFLSLGGLAESKSAESAFRQRYIYGTLHQQGDVDFYSLKLESFAGRSSNILVNFEPSFGRVKLRLRDALGNLVTAPLFESESSARIDVEYLPRGQYYAEVYSDATNPLHYSLTSVMTPRGLPRDSSDTTELSDETPQVVPNPDNYSFSGTIYTPGDTDAFRFSLVDYAAISSKLELQYKSADGQLHLALFTAADVNISLAPIVKVLEDGFTKLTYDVSSLPPGEYKAVVRSEWYPQIRTSWDRYFDLNRYTLTTSISPLGEYRDLYEPNGVLTEASPLVQTLDYSLPANWPQTGIPDRRQLPSISGHLETDIYQVTLIGWGQSRNGVVISSVGGRIQAEITNTSGTTVRQTTVLGGSQTLLSLEGQPPGSYFIKLRGLDAKQTVYSLTPNLRGIIEDTLEPDSKSSPRIVFGIGLQDGTIHRTNDEDWYSIKFDRVAKFTNQLQLEYVGDASNVIGTGRLAIELFNAAGVLVGKSDSESEPPLLKLTGLPPGTYSAKISGEGISTNSYRLRYDLNTDARLPYTIQDDGYPYTNVSNSNPLPVDNVLVNSGRVVWLEQDDLGRSTIFVFDSTLPNARPQVIARDIFLNGAFHTDGDHVVWSASGEIFLFDGMQVLQLTQNITDDRNPRVSGGRVVWEQQVAQSLFGPYIYEIFLYDVQGVRALTSKSNADNIYPQIDGDIITWTQQTAWIGNNFNNTLFVYDGLRVYNLGEGNLAPTDCVGIGNGCRPESQISDGRVVYTVNTQPNLSQQQVWYWDKEVHFLYQFNGLSFPPVIGGDFIAWQSFDQNISYSDGQWIGELANSYNIFLYDGITIRQLTDNKNREFAEYPWISHSRDGSKRLVWHQGRGDSDPEIMVYEEGTIRQLTDNSYEEFHFRENAGQVVWVNNDPRDVFLIDIQPQSIEAMFMEPVVIESAGSANLRLQRRYASIESPLPVNLTLDESTSLIQLPATVVFPAGVSQLDVPVKVIDNQVFQGDKTIRVLATSSGFRFGEAELLVREEEPLELQLSYAGSVVYEDSGPNAVALRVKRLDEDRQHPITITLATSDASITLPSTVTIPVSVDSVDVMMSIANDGERKSPKSVEITAQATGFLTASTTLELLDTSHIQIQAIIDDGTAVAEGKSFDIKISREGMNTDDPILIQLNSSIEGVLLSPSVFLDRGVASKIVRVDLEDDEVAFGERELVISAEAPNIESSQLTLKLVDNDIANIDLRAGSVTSLQNLPGGGQFMVVLNGPPSSPVSVHLSTPEVTLSPDSFILDSSNWETGVSVTASSNVSVSAITKIISIAASTDSDDPSFDGLTFFTSFTSTLTANPWNNQSLATDVNGDSFVSAIDALFIINEINTNGSFVLGYASSYEFFDVNGDWNLSAVDVLIIVNELNSGTNGEGEFVANPSDYIERSIAPDNLIQTLVATPAVDLPLLEHLRQQCSSLQIAAVRDLQDELAIDPPNVPEISQPRFVVSDNSLLSVLDESSNRDVPSVKSLKNTLVANRKRLCEQLVDSVFESRSW